MNVNRYRWRKRNPRIPIQPVIFVLSFVLIFFFIISYTGISNYFFFTSAKTLISQFPQCETFIGKTHGNKFLWFAPHSGFSNQLSELKNAILMAAILNRTLVIPPILDHHAVALGSCPKFRVSDPNDLRIHVWDHSIQLLQGGRYISMADIVDLSSLVSSSMIKTIDFRVFASLWCDLDTHLTCFDVSEMKSSVLSSLKQCGSLLSGMEGNVDKCLYTVKDDCRTTVWTYQQNHENDILDSFQPDEKLQKKKNISYVRKRKDVYKTLGPDSEAGFANVLTLGSLFTAPYKGSESHIDIHEAPRDQRIQSLIKKVEFLPFVPEITNAGKKFAVEKIKAPFICAQLRLLDGQFKNHREATFLALKQKLESLRKEGPLPIHIFVMTDLPEANWTGNYLEDLARDSDTYKLYSLQAGDKLVVQTAKKLATSGLGMKSGFLPRNIRASKVKKDCPSEVSPDVLLYIEETICSCGSLGFVGTAGSTITESIELMRKNGICLNQDQS